MSADDVASRPPASSSAAPISPDGRTAAPAWDAGTGSIPTSNPDSSWQSQSQTQTHSSASVAPASSNDDQRRLGGWLSASVDSNTRTPLPPPPAPASSSTLSHPLALALSYIAGEAASGDELSVADSVTRSLEKIYLNEIVAPLVKRLAAATDGPFGPGTADSSQPLLDGEQHDRASPAAVPSVQPRVEQLQYERDVALRRSTVAERKVDELEERLARVEALLAQERAREKEREKERLDPLRTDAVVHTPAHPHGHAYDPSHPHDHPPHPSGSGLPTPLSAKPSAGVYAPSHAGASHFFASPVDMGPRTRSHYAGGYPERQLSSSSDSAGAAYSSSSSRPWGPPVPRSSSSLHTSYDYPEPAATTETTAAAAAMGAPSVPSWAGAPPLPPTPVAGDAYTPPALDPSRHAGGGARMPSPSVHKYAHRTSSYSYSQPTGPYASSPSPYVAPPCSAAAAAAGHRDPYASTSSAYGSLPPPVGLDYYSGRERDRFDYDHHGHAAGGRSSLVGYRTREREMDRERERGRSISGGDHPVPGPVLGPISAGVSRRLGGGRSSVERASFSRRSSSESSSRSSGATAAAMRELEEVAGLTRSSAGGGGSGSKGDRSEDGEPPRKAPRQASVDEGGRDRTGKDKKTRTENHGTPTPPRKLKSTMHRTCTSCHAPHNAKFRPGPAGPGSLCDRCGSRWKKRKTEEEKEKDAAAAAAAATSSATPTAPAGGPAPVANETSEKPTRAPSASPSSTGGGGSGMDKSKAVFSSGSGSGDDGAGTKANSVSAGGRKVGGEEDVADVDELDEEIRATPSSSSSVRHPAASHSKTTAAADDDDDDDDEMMQVEDVSDDHHSVVGPSGAAGDDGGGSSRSRKKRDRSFTPSPAASPLLTPVVIAPVAPVAAASADMTPPPPPPPPSSESASYPPVPFLSRSTDEAVASAPTEAKRDGREWHVRDDDAGDAPRSGAGAAVSTTSSTPAADVAIGSLAYDGRPREAEQARAQAV